MFEITIAAKRHDQVLIVGDRELQHEIVQLRDQLNEFRLLYEKLQKENELWLSKNAKLTKELFDSNEALRMDRKRLDCTTKEMEKLVEKIEREKGRMKTSYEYFDGLSKAYRQREDEWIAEKSRLTIELIRERTFHAAELKNEQNRYKSMEQQKDDKHKTDIERLRREFEEKLNNCVITCFE